MILIIAKLRFQKNNDFASNIIIGKKQQRPKKVSNFYLATFVWLNKNFEYISPKLCLLGRKNWDSCEKGFTPIKRFIHFLFLLLKLSTNIYVRMKKFPFFCKILIFKAQIENRLSLWCGLKEKDVWLITDICKHDIS